MRTGDRPRYGDPELDDDDDDVKVTGDIRDGVSPRSRDVAGAPRVFCCGGEYARKSDVCLVDNACGDGFADDVGESDANGRITLK